MGSGSALRGPEIPVRPLARTSREQEVAMRALGYVTTVTSAALALLVVMSIPDVRRYLKMRKM